jgi:TRAP-type C4-dicarboxylate transport system permease small subunit
MKKFVSLYEKALYLGMVLAGFTISFMAITISADVLLRNLTLLSLPWVVEVSEYILFIATFLAAPWVLHLEGHVRVDLVVRCLQPKPKMIVQAIADFISLTVCLFLLYYGAKSAWEAWVLKTIIFKQLVIPEWWLLSFIPVTGLFLTAELLCRFSHLFENGAE